MKLSNPKPAPTILHFYCMGCDKNACGKVENTRSATYEERQTLPKCEECKPLVAKFSAEHIAKHFKKP